MKRKEREREENAGAARSAAGGQARGACPSRSPRHGQLPVIPIVQRPPGAGVAGTASGRQREPESGRCLSLRFVLGTTN